MPFTRFNPLVRACLGLVVALSAAHLAHAQPQNNICGQNQAAHTIPGTGGTVNGSLQFATNDGGSTCTGAGGPDVYYYFTPAVTGLHRFSTCGSPTNTILSLHTACPANGVNMQMCNDDASGCAGASQFDFNVTAGTAYVIRVGGFTGTSIYTFTLAVNPNPVRPCCLPNGSCVTTFSLNCTGQGGVVQPGGTACSPNPCPQPGACCNTSGCTVTLPAGCASGTFIAGASCTPSPCPPVVACCRSNGACITRLGSCNPDEVQSGTNCFSSNCQQPGACCDGTTNACVFTAICGPGHEFLGEGVSCAASPCAGACCGYSTGVCTFASPCPAGSFNFGRGRTCAANPCPPVGACCDGGVCAIRPISDCASGTGGAGTVCQPDTCRACCTSEGACVLAPQIACTGTYHAGLSTCSPSPCAGACCLLDGSCISAESPSCPGYFQGTFATCVLYPCPPVGACCLSNGTCVIRSQTECTGVSQFMGVGASCNPHPCPPVGACCRFDGACIYPTTLIGCVLRGQDHQWTSAGATCSPWPCPSPGACCLGSCCSVVTQFACEGTFTQPGQACAPGICPDPNLTCATALTVTVPYLYIGCNFGSAVSQPPPSCVQATEAYNPRWFRFSSPGGNFSISTCDARSDPVPMHLSIFTGSCGGLTPVPGGCNILSCAAANIPSGATSGHIESIPLPAADYFIMVSSASPGTGGRFRLTIQSVQLGACCEVATSQCVFTTSAACGRGASDPNAFVFMGQNVSCAPNPCLDRGACCRWDGSCGISYQLHCPSPEHFAGSGTVCSSGSPCAQLGACCTTSDSSGCVVTTLAACNALPGSHFYGVGAACASSSCTVTGACCFLGSGCVVTTVAGCAPGRSFAGPGTSCSPAPCGACCSGSGCLYVAPNDCNPANFTPGTVCTGTCGACCEGGTCVIRPLDACQGAFAPNFTCSTSACGACCLDDGTCHISFAISCNGRFFSAGSCTPELCRGACCLPNGSCLNVVSSACAGSFRGIGTACGVDPCPPVGACCTVNLQCVIREQAGCVGTSQFMGVGLGCSPTVCPTPAACCTVQGTCLMTSEHICLTTNPANQFQGGDTPCMPTPCAPAAACCNGTCCTIVAPFACAGEVFSSQGFCLPSPCPIGNTVCDGATPVQVGVPAYDCNHGAAGMEFTSACAPEEPYAFNPRWFVFNSPGGWYRLTTCRSTAQSVTTHIAIMSGAGCGSLSELAGVCATSCISLPGGTSPSALISSVNLPAGAYRIMVFTTTPGEAGLFALDITPAPTGACCTGTNCTVISPESCAGAFQGSNTTCGPANNPTTCCPANFNQQGGISVQDIFDFLAAYFSNQPSADFNHSGVLSVQDIFDFLAAYFAGCA